jgi:2,5-diamino-6-(ribosylamino)-4(3H)-pyrimidinone 5'-phosphate reductase
MPDPGKPFTFLNMAMTADGKITSTQREYADFTSQEDSACMDRIRAMADAIVIGAGTLRNDDPPLQVKDTALRANRVAQGKQEFLTQVVVTRTGDVPVDSDFFQGAGNIPRLVAVPEILPADKRNRLEQVAELLTAGQHSVDPAALLHLLKNRGHESILLEGGGELNWSFLEMDLVDELFITLAPVLFGGAAAPTWLEGTGWTQKTGRKLQLLDMRRHDQEIFLHYKVCRT